MYELYLKVNGYLPLFARIMLCISCIVFLYNIVKNTQNTNDFLMRVLDFFMVVAFVAYNVSGSALLFDKILVMGIFPVLFIVKAYQVYKFNKFKYMDEGFGIYILNLIMFVVSELLYMLFTSKDSLI
ncbi:MAG: hypothetical protein Q4A42_05135 [Tissierellia bacterium]|nr:hypothetical protein [Tissierellia bacterium]